MRKRSVGLVVVTNVPSYGGLVAVLQVRGEFNHEKMAPESFPGACQVTAHGKCEEHESFYKGLIREVREELGPDLAYVVSVNLDEKTDKLIILETEDEVVVNYGVFIPSSLCLAKLRLTASSGGIRLIREDQLDSIVDLKTFNKATGVMDRSVTAMFRDEIKAVRLAFDLYSVMMHIE